MYGREVWPGGFGRGPRPEEAGGRQAAKAVHHLGRARRRIRRPGRAPASLAAAAGNPPCGPAFPAGRTLPGRDPRAGPGGRRGPRTGWICGSGPDVALYVRRARAKKNSIRPLCSWMVRVYVRRARAKKEPRQKRGWWDKKLFIRDGVRPSPGLFSYKRRGRRDTPYGAYRRAPAPGPALCKARRAQSRPRAGPGRRLAPHCMFPDPPPFRPAGVLSPGFCSRSVYACGIFLPYFVDLLRLCGLHGIPAFFRHFVVNLILHLQRLVQPLVERVVHVCR